MKDFCIVTTEKDEILLNLGNLLGKEEINIEGLCLITNDEKCVVHFAVEDEEKTIAVLEKENYTISAISDVYVFDKDDKQVTGKPGSFGSICQILKENNIAIRFGYPAENNRFIFGVDNIEKAKALLK